MGSVHLTPHEAIVRRLGVKYRAERSGCGAALFRELSSRFDVPREDFPETVLLYRPDLFLIEPTEALVTVWEVEVCSPLTRHQICQFAAVQWFLYDDFEWDLQLRIVDRYGNENCMDVIRGDSGRFEVVTKEQAAALVKSLEKRYSKRPERTDA